MTYQVLEGDCVELMAAMPSGSVDAVVCDPPAGIGFMGREWDHHRGGRNEWVEWMADVLREALRVCKPGAHAFVWSLPRTSHWTGSALELAGWEVRDCVTHLFGSGFPKSLNLPNGFGTALKPAAEFWWLVRKPLSGTVSATVLEHGTGALNIAATRVGADGGGTHCANRDENGNCLGHDNAGRSTSGETFHGPDGDGGRWPANVVLDGEAAGLLDEQTGELQRQGNKTWGEPSSDGATSQVPNASSLPVCGYGDSGGASRFFYVAKASRAERNAGLEGFEERSQRDTYGDGLQGPRPHTREDYEWERKGARNSHPTVKPISLMRWLVRLVTPPGGTVLDPFCGSGSTGCAAVLEGFDFIGLEREAEYVAIAEARIAWWHKHRGTGEAVEILVAGELRDSVEATGQLGMFD